MGRLSTVKPNIKHLTSHKVNYIDFFQLVLILTNILLFCSV